MPGMINTYLRIKKKIKIDYRNKTLNDNDSFQDRENILNKKTDKKYSG